MTPIAEKDKKLPKEQKDSLERQRERKHSLEYGGKKRFVERRPMVGHRESRDVA